MGRDIDWTKEDQRDYEEWLARKEADRAAKKAAKEAKKQERKKK